MSSCHKTHPSYSTFFTASDLNAVTPPLQKDVVCTPGAIGGRFLSLQKTETAVKKRWSIAEVMVHEAPTVEAGSYLEGEDRACHARVRLL